MNQKTLLPSLSLSLTLIYIATQILNTTNIAAPPKIVNINLHLPHHHSITEFPAPPRPPSTSPNIERNHIYLHLYKSPSSLSWKEARDPLHLPSFSATISHHHTTHYNPNKPNFTTIDAALIELRRHQTQSPSSSRELRAVAAPEKLVDMDVETWKSLIFAGENSCGVAEEGFGGECGGG